MRALSTTDETVIAQHACPRCGARRGAACVYLAPPGYTGYTYSEGGKERAARIGKPTKRPHLERRQRYYDAQAVRRQRAHTAAARAAGPPWLPALRAFDAAEVEAMRDWLRANYHLFGLRRQGRTR